MNKRQRKKDLKKYIQKVGWEKWISTVVYQELPITHFRPIEVGMGAWMESAKERK